MFIGYIWVIKIFHNISPTWIQATWGWFPLQTIIYAEVVLRSLQFTQIHTSTCLNLLQLMLYGCTRVDCSWRVPPPSRNTSIAVGKNHRGYLPQTRSPAAQWPNDSMLACGLYPPMVKPGNSQLHHVWFSNWCLRLQCMFKFYVVFLPPNHCWRGIPCHSHGISRAFVRRLESSISCPRVCDWERIHLPTQNG